MRVAQTDVSPLLTLSRKSTKSSTVLIRYGFAFVPLLENAAVVIMPGGIIELNISIAKRNDNAVLPFFLIFPIVLFLSYIWYMLCGLTHGEPAENDRL